MSMLGLPSHDSDSRSQDSAADSRKPGGNVELLVFGYHCKLFRDDSMAAYIDEEKHLIPWMGDKDLMIDRYDGRGHLYNAEEFSPSPLSQQDECKDAVEQQCDLERYRDWQEAEAASQKAAAEDEERTSLRRLLNLTSSNYQNVAHAYEPDDSEALYDPEEEEYKDKLISSGNLAKSRNDDAKARDEARKSQIAAKALDADRLTKLRYKVPDGLHIPAGMELPEGMKMHAIVEKTATFISKQGTQMEIVLKAKQAGNPQFEFLNFGNWLNPYYKAVLQQIRSGSYVPQTEKQEPEQPAAKEERTSSSDSDDSDGEFELHPSLQAHRSKPVTTSGSTTKGQATIESKPPEVRHTLPIIPFSPGDFVKQYMARKYASRAHLQQRHASADEAVSPKRQDSSPSRSPQPGTPERAHSPATEGSAKDAMHSSEFDVNEYLNEYYSSLGYDPDKCKEYIASLAYSYVTSLGQQVQASSSLPPPPPGIDAEDETLSWLKTSQTPKLSDVLSAMTYEQLSHFQQQLPNLLAPPPPPPGDTIVVPPANLKTVIDKLAEYAVKNGSEFEEGIKQKRDPRFEFLSAANTYHAYYMRQKADLMEMMAKDLIATPSENAKAKTVQKMKELGSMTAPPAQAEPRDFAAKPIRFALKKKQDISRPSDVITAKEAFPEEEDDDDDQDVQNGASPVALIEGEGYRPAVPVLSKANGGNADEQQSVANKQETSEELEKRLLVLQQQKLEEEELRQKITEQARLAKERQVQIERRRRAAAFIGMLKQNKLESSAAVATSHPEPVTSEASQRTTSKRRFTETRNPSKDLSDSDEPVSPPAKLHADEDSTLLLRRADSDVPSD